MPAGSPLLADGAYAITFAAVDRNGVTTATTPLACTLVIDTVGPKVTALVFNRLAGQLQVSFQPEQLARFMADAVEHGLDRQAALLPSICLVRSPSALRFVDEHVPGISVPPATIERCEQAVDPEQECFEVACELAEHARSL